MVLLFTSLYLTNELHFSMAEAGFIMSFFGIGSVLGAYAGGWLTDRRSFYDIMLYSLISSGLILLVIITVTSPILLSVIIFLYAFSSDSFRPANAAAITAYSSSANRTRSVSLIRLAINLGFSVGPAAGGFIAFYVGYKWLFIIDAFTSFAAAGMLFFFLPRNVNKEDRKANKILRKGSVSAYRDYKYLFFILMVTIFAICFFQLFVSMPQYFSKVAGYNEHTIGLLLAFNGLLVVILEMPLVAALENRKRIFSFIIAGTLCIPFAFAIAYLGGNMLFWALVYTVVITFSEILAMPFMMNYSLSMPKERQGEYSALYSIAYGIAMIVAPLLGLGIAEKYGFDAMFFSFIFLGTLASAGFFLLNKRSPA